MHPDQRTTYGFVGTGEIAAAIVQGLNANVTDAPTIFLSPRGHEIGQELAERFPDVHVCDGNQDVLDNATTIVLAVRSHVAREVLAEMTFGPQHVLISAVAGVPLTKLRDWARSAGHIVRAIPLPPAARGHSLTAMYPDNATAGELFSRVGGLFVPSDEEAFDAVSAATATFAAHLDYLATIALWLADHGVEHSDATAYVTHVFGQLGRSLLEGTGALETLARLHMTPGGNNERFMTDLRHSGVPDEVRHALDRILTSAPKARPWHR